MFVLYLCVCRCNRYNAIAKADRSVKAMQSGLEREYVNKAYRELEDQQHKFEHYHDRYNNHLQSLDVRARGVGLGLGLGLGQQGLQGTRGPAAQG